MPGATARRALADRAPLAGVLLRALSLSPADRFATARAMLDEARRRPSKPAPRRSDRVTASTAPHTLATAPARRFVLPVVALAGGLLVLAAVGRPAGSRPVAAASPRAPAATGAAWLRPAEADLRSKMAALDPGRDEELRRLLASIARANTTSGPIGLAPDLARSLEPAFLRRVETAFDAMTQLTEGWQAERERLREEWILEGAVQGRRDPDGPLMPVVARQRVLARRASPGRTRRAAALVEDAAATLLYCAEAVLPSDRPPAVDRFLFVAIYRMHVASTVLGSPFRIGLTEWVGSALQRYPRSWLLLALRGVAAGDAGDAAGATRRLLEACDAFFEPPAPRGPGGAAACAVLHEILFDWAQRLPDERPRLRIALDRALASVPGADAELLRTLRLRLGASPIRARR